MSLLMDALKKAEEEKKRAAKRVMDQPDVESREETDSRDSIENNSELPDKESIKSEQFSQTMELSLEPTSEDQTDTSVFTKDNQDIATPEEDLSINDDTEVLKIEDLVTHETFDKAQGADNLNDTITISDGLNMEDVLVPFDDDTIRDVLDVEEQQAGDIDEETLSDITAHQRANGLKTDVYKLTPAVAQTVFSTGKPSHNRSSFKWALFFVLVILVVGSYSTFYYFTTTPVSRNMPSPAVAQGVESTNVALPPTQAVIPNNIVAGVGAEAVGVTGGQTWDTEKPDTSKAAELAQINKQIIEKFDVQNAKTVVDNKPGLNPIQVVDEVTGIQDNSETIADKDDANKTRQPQEEKVDVANIHKTAPIISAVTPAKGVSTDVSTFPLIQSKNALFSTTELLDISKNKPAKKQGAIIKKAFKAYQTGRYLEAKPLYQAVLKDDPDNRDARLGMAAIAVNENDHDTAHSHYSYLLKLNPDDVLTLNALIALSGSSDLVADESAVKTLLTKEPDAPYLYFSLGNLYAKQKRWSEAQQAFFYAYQLDSSNAGYVLNLAISLDRLGKYSTALDYYKTAIGLAQSGSIRFDFTAVEKRISTLDKFK